MRITFFCGILSPGVHLSCYFLLHLHTLVSPCLPGVNSELSALSLLSHWLPEACISVSLGCWSQLTKVVHMCQAASLLLLSTPSNGKGYISTEIQGISLTNLFPFGDTLRNRKGTEGVPMIVRDTIYWQLPWGHQQRKGVTNRLNHLELASRVMP